MGPCELTVASDGIRLQNTGKMAYILVARAPEWRVYIFRNDDKTYATQSLQEFEDTGLVSGFIMSKRKRDLTSKAFRYSQFKLDGHSITRMTSNAITFKFIPLNGFPAQVENIIYAAYKTPTNGGIPIGYNMVHNGKDYVTGMNQEGERSDVLTTSKISKVAVTPETFTMPKGYKLVNSVGHIVSGSKVRDESADFQALFESPKGLHSKHSHK